MKLASSVRDAGSVRLVLGPLAAASVGWRARWRRLC
eukprot:COSAG02_NODE_35695_length_464_cov_72.194521_1_plen_35_part_01